MKCFWNPKTCHTAHQHTTGLVWMRWVEMCCEQEIIKRTNIIHFWLATHSLSNSHSVASEWISCVRAFSARQKGVRKGSLFLVWKLVLRCCFHYGFVVGSPLKSDKIATDGYGYGSVSVCLSVWWVGGWWFFGVCVEDCCLSSPRLFFFLNSHNKFSSFQMLAF